MQESYLSSEHPVNLKSLKISLSFNNTQIISPLDHAAEHGMCSESASALRDFLYYTTPNKLNSNTLKSLLR